MCPPKPGEMLQIIKDGYYTYVLRSLVDGKLYIGYSADLQTRFEAHRVTHSKNRTFNRERNDLQLLYQYFSIPL